MQRAKGLLVAAALAATAFGHAGAARAAAPPAIAVQIVGQGTVTGTGISCGLGSLTCYSAYGSAAAVALTATPASGWTFSGWQDGAGSCGATAANCAVTPGSSVTATAVFTTTGPVQASTLGVALATSGSPAMANGSVTNGSASAPIDCSDTTTQCRVTVSQGSTITLVEAPSDTAHFFAGWGGACAGAAVSCSVYLSADQFVSAAFASNAPNTLTVSVAGFGSVSGGGISCGAGASCNAPEPPNSNVTLTATPQSGYVLTGWSGDCTGSQSTCTVQMNAARTVTATFAQLVPLAVTVTGSGYVTGGGIGCDGTPLGQTCTAGETPNTIVTLTAHPNAGGSVFWSGCTSTAGNFCTLNVSTSALTVSLSFTGGTPPPVATNSLTVSVTGDGYVTSFGGGSGIYCTAAGGSGCTGNEQANTTITLTAVPASGASANFTGWTGDCAAFISTTCTLTMSSAKRVQATFAGGNTTYVLTAQVTGSGTISGAGLSCTGSGSGCSASQAAGATVTLAVTAGPGATFNGWGGACSGTTTTCTVAMTNAKSVTATFASSGGGSTNNLSITVSGAGTVKGPGGSCTSTRGRNKVCTQPVTGSGTVTLTAVPAAGFALSAWSGSCSGAKATCDLPTASGRSVSATFVELTLAATHTPTIVETKAGYRITLWFHAGASGRLFVATTLPGGTVVRHAVAVKEGGRHVLVTVSRHGRYVVTLTLAGHLLRWRVKV